MLLNLQEILEPAVKDNFAVGGFNVTESTMFKGGAVPGSPGHYPGLSQ